MEITHIDSHILSQTGIKLLEKKTLSNFQEYLKTLSDLLNKSNNDPTVGKTAAIHLRDSLTSQDDIGRVQCEHRWLSMHEYVRQYIKKNVINALATDQTRPSVVAECVAAVASAEFAADGSRWQDIMSRLICDVLKPGNNKILLKAASLDAIGYICRDIRDWRKEWDVINTMSAEIYRCIIFGLRSNYIIVIIAATNALIYALCWIIPHLKNECDRELLMQIICDTAQIDDAAVKTGGIYCLMEVMSDFYDYVEQYIDYKLFTIVRDALTSNRYEVLLSGIKLCNKLCYLVASMEKQALRSASEKGSAVQQNYFFTEKNLNELLVMLTNLLTKYEIFGEKDEDGIMETCVHCLTLLATCYEDSTIRDFIAKFVEDNFRHCDWKYRNAAILVFSSLISEELYNLNFLLNETLPLLIHLLNDDSSEVKATAAHVIAKVCDHIGEGDAFEPNLQTLVKTLLRSLNGKILVAKYACLAIERLAVAMKTFALCNKESMNCIIDLFPHIMKKLLETMYRSDSDNDLRSWTFQAIESVLDICHKDNYFVIQKSIEDVLKRLQTLHHDMEAVLMKSKNSHLACILCITLKCLLTKLKPEDSRPLCLNGMNILLQIFNAKGFDIDVIDEKVLWTLTSFVKMLGDVFSNFMPSFKNLMISGLRSRKKYPTLASVGLTADVCRAVGCKFFPCCDDVIPILLEILQNESSDRHLKQATLATLGTIAEVTGPYFRKFLRSVIKMLVTFQLKVDDIHMEKNFYDRGYNLNELHKYVLRAYIGIVQGMKSDSRTVATLKQDLKPCLSSMMQVICHIADSRKYLSMYDATSVEVLNEMCTHFGKEVLHIMETPPIYRLLAHARNSQNRRTKRLGTLVSTKINKLKMYT